jgi:hypothetical protein
MRRAQAPDLQECAQSFANGIALGRLAQKRLRELVLLFDPFLHGRAIAVLEPAVRIDELDAVQDVHDVVNFGGRIFGHGGLCECVRHKKQESDTCQRAREHGSSL